jgi:Rrf2 family cysteine metabolism transcriptional repressor
MVALGRRHGSGPVSLTELAAQEDLPRPDLEQLAMALRDAELVSSTRGARGGYELARPPEAIPMAEVLRALEGPIAPMICASEDPDHAGCDRTSRCTVNLLWLRIRDAIAVTLDSITLADLVPQRAIAIERLGDRVQAAGVPAATIPATSVPAGSVPPETGAADASPAALAEPVTA